MKLYSHCISTVLNYCQVLRVHVTKIMGSSLDDWIYWFLLCTVSLNYKPYSSIADLHTFQFTVAHALGFSVSTSRILETDLNTDTITSNHYEVFSPFLIKTPWTTDSQNSDLRRLNLQFYLQSDLDLSCKHNLVI
jgi:hypothetical protein